MKQKIKAAADWCKEWLGKIAIILSIMGLVTFSMFICEEAFQTAMFGTWPAQDAKDWAQVKRGCDIMEGANSAMKFINYGFGWIQPLALLSYYEYGKSASYYIESLRIKAFAHCPECFDGETILFHFKPNAMLDEWPRNGRIVIMKEVPWKPGDIFRIKGKVMAGKDGLVMVSPVTIQKVPGDE